MFLREPTQESADESHLDVRPRRVERPLAFLGVDPIPVYPRVTSFHDPPFLENLKPMRRALMDDTEIDAAVAFDLRLDRPLIRSIRIRNAQRGEARMGAS